MLYGQRANFHGNKNDVEIRVCGEHPKIDVAQ
jgi:hypothetical protein